MRSRPWRPLVAAILLGVAMPASATMLRHMTLQDLAASADRVFRGTVVGIDSTTIQAGGSELPVTIYRIKVVEGFKGSFATPKGEPVVELRMLSARKANVTAGGMQRLAVLSDLPTLAMGGEYVLFTTRPSAIGLSTTVGLGQGAFAVQVGTKEELTANKFSNAGLAWGSPLMPDSGPVPYARFAQAVRQAVAEVRR